MKNKKIILFCILMGSMFTLGGCGDAIDLTDNESDLISRYAAGCLLDSSEVYDGRLELMTKAPDDTRLATETATDDPIADVEQNDLPTTASEPTATPSQVSPSTPNQSTEPGASNKKNVTLDDIYKISGLTFSYNSYGYYKQYPKKNSVIQVYASRGKTLLVVKFRVKNTSGKTRSVNLVVRDQIVYALKAGGNTYLPEFAVLDDALTFLMEKIKPGKTIEAVLVYSLPKGLKNTKGLSLRIQENEKEAVVLLK